MPNLENVSNAPFRNPLSNRAQRKLRQAQAKQVATPTVVDAKAVPLVPQKATPVLTPVTGPLPQPPTPGTSRAPSLLVLEPKASVDPADIALPPSRPESLAQVDVQPSKLQKAWGWMQASFGVAKLKVAAWFGAAVSFATDLFGKISTQVRAWAARPAPDQRQD